MILEMHAIQSFGLSNLNRDDTGSPKDCVFGGVRRARLSSQAIKRAVRLHPAFGDRVELAGGTVGVRSKRIVSQLTERLEANHNMDATSAEKLAHIGVLSIGPKLDLKQPDRKLLQYLLYVGPPELDEIAAAIVETGDADSLLEMYGLAEQDEQSKKAKGASDLNTALLKRLDGADSGKALKKRLKDLVSSERLKVRATAADIALFGRMVADAPVMNVEAASQVAHAVSTHEVDTTLDYYTAVDDFNVDDEGAGMIGILEYNSSCYYRYANVNLGQLEGNLAFNQDLRNAALLGFVDASVRAVPTGKQHATAAQSPPEWVRVVLRDDGFPWSLVNAFSSPVRYQPQREEGSIINASITRADSYFSNLKSTYGSDSIHYEGGFSIGGEGSLPALLQELETKLQEIPASSPKD